VKEQNGYEGGLTNPMSWERTVEKFHWLTEAYADEELRSRLIGAVERLDTSRLSGLTDLLAQVRSSAVFPTTQPGIQ
jgi:2-methylcitrate dehydratase